LRQGAARKRDDEKRYADANHSRDVEYQCNTPP
jgi:hypothetical protein